MITNGSAFLGRSVLCVRKAHQSSLREASGRGHERYIQGLEQVLEIRGRVRELDDGATVDAGLVGRLRQPLYTAEKGRVLRKDAPMYAKLGVLSVQNDIAVLVPYL